MFTDKPSLQQAHKSPRAYETRHSVPINDPLLSHLLQEVPIREYLANEITSCKMLQFINIFPK